MPSNRKAVTRNRRSFPRLVGDLRALIQQARQQALRAVDLVQVRTCWEVGRHIVEFEQGGAARAAYGAKLLPQLAERLTTEFGKGFDDRNLWYMCSFYRAFPILNALRSELSWTHYRLLLSVEDTDAREWYMNEAAGQHWGTRALQRQIGTLYYNHLLKCFVLFDLKTEELTHQDIGQMDMYVRMYDDLRRGPDDNPTVGVILCARKDETVVRYSVLNEHKRLFASRYRLILPSEKVLRAELMRERRLLTETPCSSQKPIKKKR